MGNTYGKILANKTNSIDVRSPTPSILFVVCLINTSSWCVSVFLGYYPILVSLFTWAMAGEQAGGALRHWEMGSRGKTYLGEAEYNPLCFLANSHTKLLHWKAPEWE